MQHSLAQTIGFVTRRRVTIGDLHPETARLDLRSTTVALRTLASKVVGAVDPRITRGLTVLNSRRSRGRMEARCLRTTVELMSDQ